MPTRSAWRRLARSSTLAWRYAFTAASGSTTVPMSRPAMTMGPPAATACCLATRTRRTPAAAATRGHDALDLLVAEAAGHVLAVEQDAGAVGAVGEGDVGGGGAGRQDVVVGNGNAAAEGGEGDGPVHDAAIEEAEAEGIRDAPSDNGLA